VAGVDDIIKQWVADVERSGEMRRNPGFGKPFDFDDGFMATPTELRMAYKVLKNAGYVPAEVEMLRKLAALRERFAAANDDVERDRLRLEMVDLETKVGVMLEKLRPKR